MYRSKAARIKFAKLLFEDFVDPDAIFVCSWRPFLRSDSTFCEKVHDLTNPIGDGKEGSSLLEKIIAAILFAFSVGEEKAPGQARATEALFLSQLKPIDILIRDSHIFAKARAKENKLLNFEYFRVIVSFEIDHTFAEILPVDAIPLGF